MRVSLSASRDSSQLMAGMIAGAGVAGRVDQGGQVQGDQVGQHAAAARPWRSRPGAGQVAKSRTAAAGSRVSRPGVAGLMQASGAGWRSSRPKPSSDRISATLVRFSGVLLRSASRAEIS